MKKIDRDKVHRISVSLPESIFQALDRMVAERGFDSRSRCLTEMVQRALVDYRAQGGTQVMAGTITLFYDESKHQLCGRLATIERRHVDEVISSQHVLLEKNHVMEVILVQGPAVTLRSIADELAACKGVRSVKLSLTSTLLPPLHASPAADSCPP